MNISVVMIDSRSDLHPDWVQVAIDSVKKQALPVEFIIVDNIGRPKTIGECWNIGVKKATGDFVFFLGDDDWISNDYLLSLSVMEHNHPGKTMYTSYMMVVPDQGEEMAPILRITTGMWNRQYLLDHPFNEKLKKGIDREYLEEAIKDGIQYIIVPHLFGYYYRKHDDYSCSGKITLHRSLDDIYVMTPNGNFIQSIAERFKKHASTYVSTHRFDAIVARQAKVIWCDFATSSAVELSRFKTDAKKFLRLHAYEAFGEPVKYIEFDKFEKVIFVADHIKEYVEAHTGKLDNAIVIPNGVDMDQMQLHEHPVNNKVAYAGYLTKKKGIQLLLFVAEHFPQYEFHVAGKFQEDDIAEYFHKKKPSNVFLYPWQYDLASFYADKSFVINTSPREGCPVAVLEGMACGLKPLIYDWIGSEKIFPGYIWRDIRGLSDLLLSHHTPNFYRDFVSERHNFETMYRQIENLITSTGVFASWHQPMVQE